MKKQQLVGTLALLLLISGCKKQQTVKTYKTTETQEIVSTDPMPSSSQVAQVESFFDEDLQEFAFVDEVNAPIVAHSDVNDSDVTYTTVAHNDMDLTQPDALPAHAVLTEDTFKTVYFDFDSYRIRPDQEAVVDYDIEQIRHAVAEAHRHGQTLPTVVVEGHACHSAGSAVYNLALSEKRAKVLADRMITAGVPQDCIKVVGRGQEMPAVIDGVQINGDRDAQSLNRRDEIRVIRG
ncbi:OmpA family protein [Vermiphilus pyriformis]|jgi:outer membrane protein OmpA-like peptidoglycan-associated protein|nr:MAG: OmpA family protein [Vermiphilus pyriformis]